MTSHSPNSFSRVNQNAYFTHHSHIFWSLRSTGQGYYYTSSTSSSVTILVIIDWWLVDIDVMLDVCSVLVSFNLHSSWKKIFPIFYAWNLLVICLKGCGDFFKIIESSNICLYSWSNWEASLFPLLKFFLLRDHYLNGFT